MNTENSININNTIDTRHSKALNQLSITATSVSALVGTISLLRENNHHALLLFIASALFYTAYYVNKTRHTRALNFFLIMAMVLSALMGTISLLTESNHLALLLYIASAVYFAAYSIHKKTGKASLSANIIVYSFCIFVLYLVQSGGVSNSGPLWVFIVSPICLYIHGLKRGLLDIACFLIVLTIIFFEPIEILAGASAGYDNDFKLRIIYSFLSVTFLAALYERAIDQSHLYALEQSKKYEHLAHFDPLTKLSNRRDALIKLKMELPRIARSHEPLSIILCDIDHFKNVNDQYGHGMGDAVLVELADLFSQQTREQDTISRWGGEEFLFILPQTEAVNAAILAEKIHLALKGMVVNYHDQKIVITVSMGIAELNGDNVIDDVINEADKYLYLAKEAGRDQTLPKFDSS